MKKLLALAAVAGGVLFAVKRNKSSKAEADLWREATAPTDKPRTNGNVPASAAKPDEASKN